jgi:hypothetical protein
LRCARTCEVGMNRLGNVCSPLLSSAAFTVLIAVLASVLSVREL